MKFPDKIKAPINDLIAHGFSPFIVGGAVRDHFMHISPKDFDIETFGCSIAQLNEIISAYGRVDIVGARFGILKLTVDGETFDFSVPRRENRIGKGHNDFEVETGGNISTFVAASRRDFTMNAIMFDIKNGSFVDHFDGIKDIRRGIIRPTSEAFSEDALRILRGMKFSGRFNFKIVDEKGLFVQAASSFNELVADNIRKEFSSLFLSRFPGSGLIALKEAGVTWLFPQIRDLMGVPQHPEWHPEGDVFTHTVHVMNEMAVICDREDVFMDERIILVAAALCHDFGKPKTTEIEKGGNWTAPGHAKEGVIPTRTFLKNIGFNDDFADKVVTLVEFHMHDKNFSSCGSDMARRRFVRRLAHKVDIRLLSMLAEADHNGRPPLPKGLPQEMRDIVSLWEEMKDSGDTVDPILMGRHLIEMGMKPSKKFGEILSKVFEMQLDGDVFDLESAKKAAIEISGG